MQDAGAIRSSSCRLFSEPNFSVGLIGNLLCRIGSSAVPFLLPLLMQLQLGYSPLHSGLMMLPAAFAGTVAKGWISPLVKRYGYDKFLLWNTILVGASIVGFASFSVGTPLALEIAILAVFGACNSMQFAAMNSVTLKGLSDEGCGQRQQPLFDGADARDRTGCIDRRRPGFSVLREPRLSRARVQDCVRVRGPGDAGIGHRVPVPRYCAAAAGSCRPLCRECRHRRLRLSLLNI